MDAGAHLVFSLYVVGDSSLWDGASQSGQVFPPQYSLSGND